MLQRTLVAFAPVLLLCAVLAAQDSPLVAAARSTQRSQTRFATDQPAPDVSHDPMVQQRSHVARWGSRITC